MQVVTEEAVNSYKKEIVWILQSDNAEQMEENILKIQDWIENFQA
jgi:broad-specificity NMP kinase